MPNKTKIDVLTVKLTVQIPLEPANSVTVLDAYKRADELLNFCSGEGHQVTIETRQNRVPAPEPAQEASEPEPAGDGLDIPDNLRRVPKRDESAAAE